MGVSVHLEQNLWRQEERVYHGGFTEGTGQTAQYNIEVLAGGVECFCHHVNVCLSY